MTKIGAKQRILIELWFYNIWMFSENIINLTCCIIIKMPAFRLDNFCAGRTKCRSAMLKKTWWWNSLALFLIVKL